MRYVKRFAVTALMMLCFACCFSACGGHYVSEKEMAKVEKQYEEGKYQQQNILRQWTLTLRMNRCPERES